MITLIVATAVFSEAAAHPPSLKSPNAPSNPASDLEFELYAVVARVTPGASTAWFATTFIETPTEQRIDQHARILTDSDGDGIVRYDLGSRVVPAKGIWLVVDMTSRRVLCGANIGPSPGSRPGSSRFPRRAFLGDPSGNFTHLAIESSALWLTHMWVRPNLGAWFIAASDGSSRDLDGVANGLLFFDTSSMTPVSPSPPPPVTGIAQGDLLLGLDYIGAKWFGDDVATHLSENIGPGVLAFASGSLAANETAGVVRAVVMRTAGSEGSVSVNYATADGESTAGVNYHARAGTLTFGTGEILKYIEIPLVNDSLYSGEGSFRIILSDAAGTTINGSPTLNVRILDDDTVSTPVRRRRAVRP